MVDAGSLRRTLQGLSRGLVLYGHTHIRVRCRLPTASGILDVVSASGAALDHRDEAVRAGFNRYEFDDDGRIVSVEAHVIDPSGQRLRLTAITERRSCL